MSKTGNSAEQAAFKSFHNSHDGIWEKADIYIRFKLHSCLNLNLSMASAD